MVQGMGVVQFGKLLSLGSSLMTLHCYASVVLVAVQAPQKPKMKICEQAPAFNFRLLHLRCATAAPLGLIAALYLHSSKHKMSARKYQSANSDNKMGASYNRSLEVISGR